MRATCQGSENFLGFCSEDAPVPAQPTSCHLTSIFRDQPVVCIFSLWKMSATFKDLKC